MGVASESIVFALKDLSQLEEVTYQNLSEIETYDFSCFGKENETISSLLKKLHNDHPLHDQEISQIIGILRE